MKPLERTFFRMSLVEQVGSGFKRIRDALQQDGQPEPLIKADKHWFSVTFKRGSPTGSQETSKMVLKLIKENPKITVKELADRLSISDRAIKKHLSNLRDQNHLIRIGGNFGGHWEVKDL